MDKHDMRLTHVCIYIRKCKQKVAEKLGHMVELLLFAICHKCDSKPLQITLNDFANPWYFIIVGSTLNSYKIEKQDICYLTDL